LDTLTASVDQENFDKLKAAYNACLDEDTIKARGVEPLIKMLNRTTGPFSEHYLDSSSSKGQTVLTDTIVELANLGVSALVAAGTGADDRDPDTVIISVSAPYSIGLPAKELYEDEKIVKKYEDVVSQVMSALYQHSDSISKSDARTLVDFEKKLAAASPDAEDRDDVTVGVHTKYERIWY
jgi:endothelin-converting enzyme